MLINAPPYGNQTISRIFHPVVLCSKRFFFLQKPIANHDGIRNAVILKIDERIGLRSYSNFGRLFTDSGELHEIENHPGCPLPSQVRRVPREIAFRNELNT